MYMLFLFIQLFLLLSSQKLLFQTVLLYTLKYILIDADAVLIYLELINNYCITVLVYSKN